MGIATYLSLNLVFVAVVLLVLKPWLRGSWRATLSVALHLVVLTVIFDSIIIWLGIVAYDQTKLLGFNIGLAPVEDFFYAILAAIMVPAIWRAVGNRQGSDVEKN